MAKNKANKAEAEAVEMVVDNNIDNVVELPQVETAEAETAHIKPADAVDFLLEQLSVIKSDQLPVKPKMSDFSDEDEFFGAFVQYKSELEKAKGLQTELYKEKGEMIVIPLVEELIRVLGVQAITVFADKSKSVHYAETVKTTVLPENVDKRHLPRKDKYKKDGETWSGQGIIPKWLVAEIQKEENYKGWNQDKIAKTFSLNWKDNGMNENDHKELREFVEENFGIKE